MEFLQYTVMLVRQRAKARDDNLDHKWAVPLWSGCIRSLNVMTPCFFPSDLHQGAGSNNVVRNNIRGSSGSISACSPSTKNPWRQRLNPICHGHARLHAAQPLRSNHQAESLNIGPSGSRGLNNLKKEPESAFRGCPAQYVLRMQTTGRAQTYIYVCVNNSDAQHPLDKDLVSERNECQQAFTWSLWRAAHVTYSNHSLRLCHIAGASVTKEQQ
jgi:hypothetical protein